MGARMHWQACEERRERKCGTMGGNARGKRSPDGERRHDEASTEGTRRNAPVGMPKTLGSQQQGREKRAKMCG